VSEGSLVCTVTCWWMKDPCTAFDSITHRTWPPLSLMEELLNWEFILTQHLKKLCSHTPEKKSLFSEAGSEIVQENFKKHWKHKAVLNVIFCLQLQKEWHLVWKCDLVLCYLYIRLQIFSRQAISFHSVARWIISKNHNQTTFWTAEL